MDALLLVPPSPSIGHSRMSSRESQGDASTVALDRVSRQSLPSFDFDFETEDNDVDLLKQKLAEDATCYSESELAARMARFSFCREDGVQHASSPLEMDVEPPSLDFDTGELLENTQLEADYRRYRCSFSTADELQTREVCTLTAH